MDNNIDSNGNINNNNTCCWFCQEQDLSECGECLEKENCNFWNDDSCDFNEFEYTWKEMSYRKFIQRSVSFKHSELQ
jgi:hypothetical protein